MNQRVPVRRLHDDGTTLARRYQVFTARNLDSIPQLARMPAFPDSRITSINS